MRYWTIAYPDRDGTDVIETLSDDEVLKEYWDYWYGRMCEKYGKDDVDANYTKEDCITDWAIVHWAVESKD